MSETGYAAERAIDRTVARRTLAVVLCFFPLVGLINAFSLLTDADRAGMAFDAREAFILEFTSMAGIIGAFPLVVLLERRLPLTSETWPRALAAYMVGSLVFSAAHVAIMVLLREAAFPLLLGTGYTFFDDVWRDSLYEYRKDLMPYAAMLLVLGLMRRLEESKLDAQAARTEARESGRLTLRSGGRTVWLDAGTLDWAEAAGNYVELRAAGRTHLARISLSALAEQLAAAGVDISRIHRSRIVNRARIVETAPLGDGDFKVVLRDGTELRGSRRFRQETG